MGRLVRYDGASPNLAHSWEHRGRYQAPVFRRAVGTGGIDFLAEWWVVGADRTAVVGAGTNMDKRAFQTRVHYPRSNQFIGGVLAGAKYVIEAGGRESGLEIRTVSTVPDLPPTGIQNEIVIETILPQRPISGWVRTEAIREATSVPELLTKILPKR